MLCMPSISENKNGLICLVISRTITGGYAFLLSQVGSVTEENPPFE